MNGKTTSKHTAQDLMPLLIDVQQNLNREISLESLAQKYGYSPFHFHRIFSDTLGETPRKYVERLRMEKAAYKLAITDETVLDIGLSVGFRNHETFSRSFKRYFGKSPGTVRKEGKDIRIERAGNPRSFRTGDCFMSEVKFESLRPMTFLSIRHLGDYYEIPDPFIEEDRLWSTLVEYAISQNVSFSRIPIGIYYDNPFLTPKEAQRCDACLSIEKFVNTTQSMRCIDFTGGKYGVIEHTGPASTLAGAFRTLASEIHASKKYKLSDGPPIEIIRNVHVNGNSSVNHTDVYLPLELK